MLPWIDWVGDLFFFELQVRRLHEICKADKSDDLVARVYPHINKLFQRLVVAIPQSQASGGLLFLVCIACALNTFFLVGAK